MLVYLIVSGLSMILALFVYSRNVRELLHQYYLLFTVAVTLWVSGSIIDQTSDMLLGLHFRLLIVFAAWMTYFLLMFVYELAQKKLAKIYNIALITLALVTSGFSLFTEYVTRGVYREAGGAIYADQGILYVPSALWLSVVGLAGAWVLIQALNDVSVDKRRRQQIQVVLLALILSGTTAISTSFILPHITTDFSYYRYTPLSLLLFSFGFGYAILRLKLFNIKVIVARGFAYILAIFGLVITYSLLVNVLAPLFSGGEVTFSGSEFTSNIITTVVLVLFYPIMKRAFDKFTNSIFFRDVYDPQVFLDHLNKILVKSIDIDVLLQESCALIETDMKVAHASFFVRDTSYYKTRYIGNDALSLPEEDLKELERLLPKTGKKIVYVDQFERIMDSDSTVVRDILRRNNIEVLVRVVSTLEYELSGIGYLLIGEKLSGNMYDNQDLRVLEIVSNELEIAVGNALRFEEIQQFNITLQDKIEEATKELKHSNAKLKELDRAKDEFVSMASHQLRTPLTAVKGYISMVLDGDAGKPSKDQKKMLGQALLSSQRMVHLITDLLNVSRIKTKKFTMNVKETYLPDLIQSELSQLKDSAKAKKLKIHYEKPKRFPTLNVDEVKLRQVIMNFMDNAIFYTPEGGEITVTLKNSRFFVEFTVKDTGIGVPKKDQHKMFTKFYRAANARKARPDGTGLGLFMAKKVVHAQGGSIVFESDPGKGSTFGFRLSKSKVEMIEK